MTAQVIPKSELVSFEKKTIKLNGCSFRLPQTTPAVINGELQKDHVRLVGEYVFYHPYKMERHVIQNGYVFDGATIPWWCWSILRVHPLSNRVITAALIHDYLYGIHCDRDKADQLFKDLLLGFDLVPLKADLMYSAVRAAGWVFYLPEGHWLQKKLDKVIK